MSDIKKKFGIAVKKSRETLGYSQEVFAEKAQVHRTYVSEIENGRVSLGINVAERLADALGMPLSTLLREAEAEYKAAPKKK